MPSAALSFLIWVESLLRGTAGASSEDVWWLWGVGSLVAYVRYAGASDRVAEGRRAGASRRAPIDLGTADIVAAKSLGRGSSTAVVMSTDVKLGDAVLGGRCRRRTRSFDPRHPHRPHDLHPDPIVLPAQVRVPRKSRPPKECN